MPLSSSPSRRDVGVALGDSGLGTREGLLKAAARLPTEPVGRWRREALHSWRSCGHENAGRLTASTGGSIGPRCRWRPLRGRLAERLADWRRLLWSRPTHGQRVLRTLLEGPIQVGSPTAQGVPWKAQGSLKRPARHLVHLCGVPERSCESCSVLAAAGGVGELPASGSQAGSTPQACRLRLGLGA